MGDRHPLASGLAIVNTLLILLLVAVIATGGVMAVGFSCVLSDLRGYTLAIQALMINQQDRHHPPPVEAAINQHPDQDRVDDADGRHLGRGGDAVQHRVADEDGQDEGGDGDDDQAAGLLPRCALTHRRLPPGADEDEDDDAEDEAEEEDDEADESEDDDSDEDSEDDE